MVSTLEEIKKYKSTIRRLGKILGPDDWVSADPITVKVIAALADEIDGYRKQLEAIETAKKKIMCDAFDAMRYTVGASDLFKKKKEQFTKEDLKPGYVVKLRNGRLRMIIPRNKGYILIGDDHAIDLDEYKDDLTFENDILTIEEVYGHTTNSFNVLKVSLNARELLWKRTTEMTAEEISKKLGYEVKIVANHD